MCESQSIDYECQSHSVIVTAVRQSPRIAKGIGNRRLCPGWKCRSLLLSQVRESVMWRVACMAGFPCPLPATGLPLGWLAPSLAPKRQKGNRHSYAELRPGSA